MYSAPVCGFPTFSWPMCSALCAVPAFLSRALLAMAVRPLCSIIERVCDLRTSPNAMARPYRLARHEIPRTLPSHAREPLRDLIGDLPQRGEKPFAHLV